jgi:plastocyanin
MKTLLLLSIFIFSGFIAVSSTVTVTNTGFAFTPDNISINVGDVVDFQIEEMHNAVEVSEATWLANGNTPLPGFDVPFGGGLVSGLTEGVHYYVCIPHASGGMKGRITVVGESGVGNQIHKPVFNIFPNPTTGKFMLQLAETGNAGSQNTFADQNTSIEIFDLPGNRVYHRTNFNSGIPTEIDLSEMPASIYIVRINSRKSAFSFRVAKQ